MTDEGLRRGDIVEVRSPAEILATLDERGMLDGLPFMPEMVRFCGRRFRVERRAQKICDTMYFAGSRRLPETVMLEDLRCDGSGHDGCQAECRLFWKEAWLQKVDSMQASAARVDEDETTVRLTSLISATAKHPPDGGRPATYICQATEHYRASEKLQTLDPRPYVREYASGNVGLWHMLRVSARAFVVELLRKLRHYDAAPVRGQRDTDLPEPRLNLQPGEWVRVKSSEEIAQTLTRDGRHRGIWFDAENMPYCGGTYRVRQRVARLIDEHTGEMIEPNDWLTLEGNICSGDHSYGRWFCPRNFYIQWNEAWLERTGEREMPHHVGHE